MPFLVPTIHPASILRSGQQIVETIAADLAKAHRISERGFVNLPQNLITVFPSDPRGLGPAYSQAIGWLEYWYKIKCPVAVDIETNSLNFFQCKLNSIALSGVDGYNTSVSFTLGDFHTIDPLMEAELVRWTRAILDDDQIMKVFQNGPFDKGVLGARGFAIRGEYFDTLLGQHMIQVDQPKTLDWIAQTYLECEAWKVDHKGDKMALERDPYKLLYYNAQDALYTGLCMGPLIRDMAERKVPKEIHELYMGFGELATDMEVVGLPVNHEKRRLMGLMLLKKAHTARGKLREILNWPDFNIYSSDHKRALLYSGKFACDPWNLAIRPEAFTKKTGEASTSYKAIIDYMEHPVVHRLIDAIECFDLYARQYREGPDEEVKKLKELGLDSEIAEYIKKPKKASEYSEAIAPDGRLHCKIQPAQKGGRFSFKPNTQNQRPGDREFFEAGPGRVLLGADKDQLELRIMACLAGVEALLNVMRDPGGDPHTYSCIQVYGKEFTEKEKAMKKLIRNMFKNVVYASIYLAQPKTVHKTIRERKQLDPKMRAGLTLGFVKRAVTGYFAQFPEIPEFHYRNMEKVEKEGFIEVPQGWRRYFPLYPAPLNEVANWPIQCCGALVVGAEMVRIQARLKEKFHGTAYCIMHGHDAVYIECNERDAEEAKKIVNEEFGSTRLEGPKGPVFLTAETEIGKNLLTAAGYPYKDYSLFHRMKDIYEEIRR